MLADASSNVFAQPAYQLPAIQFLLSTLRGIYGLIRDDPSLSVKSVYQRRTIDGDLSDECES
jgi:hypothetical protein